MIVPRSGCRISVRHYAWRSISFVTMDVSVYVPSSQSLQSRSYLWSRPFPWWLERLSTHIKTTGSFAGFWAVNSPLFYVSWSILVLLLYLFSLSCYFSWVTVCRGFNYLNCSQGLFFFFFFSKKYLYCPSVDYINPLREVRDYVLKSFFWKASAVSYFEDLCFYELYPDRRLWLRV